MLWQQEDIQQYIGAKEYIDTLLIPLVPLSFDKDATMEKSAYQTELIHLFTKEIEKEFKGRIVLSPDYTYLASVAKDKETARLSEWMKSMSGEAFKHVFFFTFDSQWKKQEKSLDGTMIWFPAMKTEDISDKETQAVIKSQVSEITEFISSYWT